MSFYRKKYSLSMKKGRKIIRKRYWTWNAKERARKALESYGWKSNW